MQGYLALHIQVAYRAVMENLAMTRHQGDDAGEFPVIYLLLEKCVDALKAIGIESNFFRCHHRQVAVGIGRKANYCE